MSGTTTQGKPPTLVPLEWECGHFGYPVARLDLPGGGDAALSNALELARRQGFRLVVWPTTGDRHLPHEILDRFGGALADRKATFSRSFAGESDSGTAPAPGLECSVVPYSGSVVSPELYKLAISAGAYSRFRLDPNFSQQQFEAMYRVWIERSVSREMADAVLVATAGRSGASDERLAGMVTVAESAGVGKIGLIAVSDSSRGKGIGSSLLLAAHRWMQERGARQARVVTQLDNAAACRLYERGDYSLSALEHIHHFWL
ncbi:MAG TPA: GNAT family N-acetyltransferase [Pirellulales bacterium]|nr:GNAT family N-acetyltransferase [Pirellulales bacterium]